ncbi:glutathione S-transferase [Aspergillus karnatakaensis]|uniref:glutathione S-transferase family protein n=1 Tax=Aspergillus karnatakaensis TaxID=1810916 RepID=UPI003CCDA640
MSTLKFFYAPGACSLAPHILLLSSGLDFTAIRIEYDGVEVQFPAEFRAINSKMKVPVLVVDNETITELPAICTAISNLAPAKGLMGKTPMENVRVLEWLNFLSGTVHSTGYGLFFRPWRWTTSEDEGVILGVKDKAREALLKHFAFIEGRLAERTTKEFAVGEQLTAVDGLLYVMYRWAKGSGFDLKVYPEFGGVVERVEKVESVRAVVETERLKFVDGL